MRESNVFSLVCHSVHGGSHVAITHDALDLTIQGSLQPYRGHRNSQVWGLLPAPATPYGYHGTLCMGTSGPVPYDWRLGPVQTPTGACLHLLASEARTVGKQAVRILLECFLVKIKNVIRSTVFFMSVDSFNDI